MKIRPRKGHKKNFLGGGGKSDFICRVTFPGRKGRCDDFLLDVAIVDALESFRQERRERRRSSPGGVIYRVLQEFPDSGLCLCTAVGSKLAHVCKQFLHLVERNVYKFIGVMKFPKGSSQPCLILLQSINSRIVQAIGVKNLLCSLACEYSGTLI